MTGARRAPAGHGAEFVAAWREVYCSVYRWRREGRFAVVPSLLGRPVFSCLPGLAYTDLAPAEAEALAREMRGRAFNIRVFGTLRREDAPPPPPPGSSVVMRLDLASFGHDPASVWRDALSKKTRWKVRRARRAGYTVSEESGPRAVLSLAAVLRTVLARHGRLRRRRRSSRRSRAKWEVGSWWCGGPAARSPRRPCA